VSHPLAPIDRARRLPRATRRALYARLRGLGPGALGTRRYRWRGWLARPDQLVGQEELAGKDTIVFRGVRRVGKTEAAIRFFIEEILAGRARLPRLIGKIPADVGMLAKRIRDACPPQDRPEWIPAAVDGGPAGVLRFPNGIEVPCFAAASPEAIVGWEGDLFLLDDIAKWAHYTETAWFHARTACSKGRALLIVATTKRGRRVLRQLLGGKFDNVLVKAPPSARANDGNLAAGFRDRRAGDLRDSELYDDDLDDSEDPDGESPFADFDFIAARVDAPPRPLVELAVWVDPATSSTTRSCKVGMVGGGIDASGTVVILANRSRILSAREWPTAAHQLLEELLEEHPAADAHLGIEDNKGGDMGPEMLHDREKLLRVARPGGKPVSVIEVRRTTASKSKTKRAQRPANLAREGQLLFLRGRTPEEREAMRELEKSLTNLTDDGRGNDDADAAVHLVNDVAGLGDEREIRKQAEAAREAKATREAFSGLAKGQESLRRPDFGLDIA
jgi:phage terminase large subunit-like protein